MPLLYPTTNVNERLQQPQVINADDSIVLSDLVRTGEASRLRRRGAMRLDHAFSASSAASRSQRQRSRSQGNWDPPSSLRVRSPSWVAVESGSDDEYTGLAGTQRDMGDGGVMRDEVEGRRMDTDTEKEKEQYDHILFCGGEGEGEEDWDDLPSVAAWEPSPLPLYPPSSSSGRPSRRPLSQRTKRNNGCGAIIHMHASPRRRQNVWMAKTEAKDVVVAMDASYFDRKAVVKILRSACGCVREGVGCAVCGNTLGTRYKPCQAAAEGLFTIRSRTVRGLRPEGPQYWHAHSNSTPTSSSSSYYVYTFFSSNVSSSPHFVFPPHSPVAAGSQLSPALDSSPTYDSGVFDRVMTQSPMPIWEEGIEPTEMEPDQDPGPEQWQEQNGYGYGATSAFNSQMTQDVPVPNQEPEPEQWQWQGTYGYRYGRLNALVYQAEPGERGEMLDPDGVVIDTGIVPTEPNSPDKLGEGMLLPER